MSRKASNDLGVPEDFISGLISKQFALVLLYEPGRTSGCNARIIHWISLGKGQVRNPICLARFDLLMKNEKFVVDRAEMFSHLGPGGDTEYQVIPDLAPTAKWSDAEAAPGVGIEYGPDLILRRETSSTKICSSRGAICTLRR